ncbi:MAG TPA: hypothetical protein VE546_17885 [Streptomyces sp.]|uniref:hypothetical protein n=1 Tax=Streptomyces sp. TaxID=1931 RepID=UPI002D27510F|nr:hypothetical protein [Streptomyces sp.]HZG05415.1 hypothetical protein [Streptomyces sp.]
MNEGIACTHCGQDRLRPFRRRDRGEEFQLCSECEAVWREGDDPNPETEIYLSEFLAVDSPGEEWEMIEPVVRHR